MTEPNPNSRSASASAALLPIAAIALVVLVLAWSSTDAADARRSAEQVRAEQDRIRAAEAPPDAVQLTPIQDPRGIDRRDVTDGAAPKGPLEGTWQLTGSQRSGLDDPGVAGILIATRSHLVVHLQFAEGTEVGVQSTWRRYRLENGELTTEVLAGHSNIGGTFAHERPGTLEKRELRFEGTRMRVIQDAGDFLDFVRIE